MSHVFDLLILAVSRVKKGFALAGMTTEPHPVTGRVWVEVVRPDGPLQAADLTLPNGQLMQPGDVVRWEGLSADPQPPYVERWALTPESRTTWLRKITPERYARFLPEHLDRDPAAVLVRRERTLCLVRSDEVNALFELDERRFKSYVLFNVPNVGSYDTPVVDLVWRALGRQWLAEQDSTEIALEAEDIQARFGPLYLVVGLYSHDSVIVRGLHTIPALEAPVNLSKT